MLNHCVQHWSNNNTTSGQRPKQTMYDVLSILHLEDNNAGKSLLSEFKIVSFR